LDAGALMSLNAQQLPEGLRLGGVVNHETIASRCGGAVLLALLASSCSQTTSGSEEGKDEALTVSDGLTVLAGVPAGRGHADGVGSAARFYDPEGVAVDGTGNVYVADTYNNTIRKVTPAGVVTTLAGAAGQYGSVDGTGSAARFNNPEGVAVDGSGNGYVGDQ